MLQITSPTDSHAESEVADSVAEVRLILLGTLPTGAHILVQCKRDWRDATVIRVSPDKTVLSVGSPSGRTYRIKRPSDSLLALEGDLHILGDGQWRSSLVRYDIRW